MNKELSLLAFMPCSNAIHQCVLECPCENCLFGVNYKCETCNCDVLKCTNRKSLDKLDSGQRINDDVWKKNGLSVEKFKKAFMDEQGKQKDTRDYQVVDNGGYGLCLFHSIS